MHLLFLADSDNARQTVPLTEIVSELADGHAARASRATSGEQYGRSFEKPLVATVR